MFISGLRGSTETESSDTTGGYEGGGGGPSIEVKDKVILLRISQKRINTMRDTCALHPGLRLREPDMCANCGVIRIEILEKDGDDWFRDY